MWTFFKNWAFTSLMNFYLTICCLVEILPGQVRPIWLMFYTNMPGILASYTLCIYLGTFFPDTWQREQ